MRPYERRQALLQMLTAQRTIARDAAAELGVSIRTIYRDVAWLRDQGFVVASVPGPRGGAWLSERSRPAPGSMSVAQLRQIAMHLGATGGDPALIEALVSTLPPKVRKRVATLIEATQSAEPVRTVAPEVGEHLEVALEQQWPLAICWHRAKPGRAPREIVLPLALRIEDGRWVLEGLNQRDGARIDCPLDETRAVDRSPRRWIRDRTLSAWYRYRRPDDPPSHRERFSHRVDGLPPGAVAVL